MTETENSSQKNSLGLYHMSERTFVDKISIAGCAYVMTMDYDTFASKYSSQWDFNVEHTDINSFETYYKRVISNCRKWFSMRKDGLEYIEIDQKYRYSERDQKNVSGRVYVEDFGIQSLQHDVRKVLTGKYYVDIDIKNCHWNILLSMINQYNDEYTDDLIKCKYIKEYCLNRSGVLEAEKAMKLDLLCLLNIDKYITSSKFLKKLHREKMKAYDAFIDNEDYLKKYGNVETDNKDNPVSSFVNKLFCINENKLLQAAIKQEHSHIVPMFDGFMLDIEYKDIYQHELINLCPEDSLIQWDFKSNICIDEEFHDFEKTFNPNDDSYISQEYIGKVKQSIGTDIIDGAVLDIIIEWLYKLCGDDIIYHDNLYFTYKNGIFSRNIYEKGNYELAQILSNRIVPYIRSEVVYFKNRLTEAAIDKKSDFLKWVKAKSVFTDWNELLKCVSSCVRVQNTCQLYVSMSKYKKKDFYDNLDGADNLIAFDNQVYDLYTDKFRPLEKKDCISITTGYKWVEPTPELMAEFEQDFLNKVFVDETIRTHFLKSICASLDGNKRRHKFTIWTNFGRNGKSLTMTFLKKMLGKYHGCMNSAILQNSKAEGGNASPQFAVLRSSRLVAMNEPEITKKINSNLVKEMSGGDDITMRRLYASDVETFKPKASIVMICNDVPSMDRNDGAVMNRLDIIPFESTFGLRPDKSIITEDDIANKEFKTDNDIETNLDKWRCCFFKTIVAHFKDYLKNPAFTLKSEINDEYTANQDLIQEYIDEKMTQSPGHKVKVKDICHHLNKYLKGKQDISHNSRTLGKYLRLYKYNVEKKNGEACLMGYNFNWLMSSGCLIDDSDDETDSTIHEIDG